MASYVLGRKVHDNYDNGSGLLEGVYGAEFQGNGGPFVDLVVSGDITHYRLADTLVSGQSSNVLRLGDETTGLDSGQDSLWRVDSRVVRYIGSSWYAVTTTLELKLSDGQTFQFQVTPHPAPALDQTTVAVGQPINVTNGEGLMLGTDSEHLVADQNTGTLTVDAALAGLISLDDSAEIWFEKDGVQSYRTSLEGLRVYGNLEGEGALATEQGPFPVGEPSTVADLGVERDGIEITVKRAPLGESGFVPVEGDSPVAYLAGSFASSTGASLVLNPSSEGEYKITLSRAGQSIELDVTARTFEPLPTAVNKGLNGAGLFEIEVEVSNAGWSFTDGEIDPVDLTVGTRRYTYKPPDHGTHTLAFSHGTGPHKPYELQVVHTDDSPLGIVLSRGVFRRGDTLASGLDLTLELVEGSANFLLEGGSLTVRENADQGIHSLSIAKAQGGRQQTLIVEVQTPGSMLVNYSDRFQDTLELGIIAARKVTQKTFFLGDGSEVSKGRLELGDHVKNGKTEIQLSGSYVENGLDMNTPTKSVWIDQKPAPEVTGGGSVLRVGRESDGDALARAGLTDPSAEYDVKTKGVRLKVGVEERGTGTEEDPFLVSSVSVSLDIVQGHTLSVVSAGEYELSSTVAAVGDTVIDTIGETRTVGHGGDVEITVSLDGAGISLLSVQWIVNNQTVRSEKGPTLRLHNVNSDMAVSYEVSPLPPGPIFKLPSSEVWEITEGGGTSYPDLQDGYEVPEGLEIWGQDLAELKPGILDLFFWFVASGGDRAARASETVTVRTLVRPAPPAVSSADLTVTQGEDAQLVGPEGVEQEGASVDNQTVGVFLQKLVQKKNGVRSTVVTRYVTVRPAPPRFLTEDEGGQQQTVQEITMDETASVVLTDGIDAQDGLKLTVTGPDGAEVAVTESDDAEATAQVDLLTEGTYTYTYTGKATGPDARNGRTITIDAAVKLTRTYNIVDTSPPGKPTLSSGHQQTVILYVGDPSPNDLKSGVSLGEDATDLIVEPPGDYVANAPLRFGRIVVSYRSKDEEDRTSDALERVLQVRKRFSVGQGRWRLVSGLAGRNSSDFASVRDASGAAVSGDLSGSYWVLPAAVDSWEVEPPEDPSPATLSLPPQTWTAFMASPAAAQLPSDLGALVVRGPRRRLRGGDLLVPGEVYRAWNGGSEAQDLDT